MQMYNCSMKTPASGMDRAITSAELLDFGHGGADFSENSQDIEIGTSSKMQNLLSEFSKLYTEKIHRVEEFSLQDKEEYLQKKVSVLEEWVEDLGEQNNALVTTVEELEREASQRVELLQDRLDKMASVTKASCLSLRDHQLEVSSIITKKLEAETEAQSLRERILDLERSNTRLLRENDNLHAHLETVVIDEKALSKERDSDNWRFYLQKQNSSPSFRREDGGEGSPYAIEHCAPSTSPQRAPPREMLSIDHLQDVEILESELHRLRSLQETNTSDLILKDRHIADLQSQLTDLHERLSTTQSLLDRTTSDLNDITDVERHDSLQISRQNDILMNLMSPSQRLKMSFKDSQVSSLELDGMSKNDIESKLSNNIDVLASRLSDLEEECEELRDKYTSLANTHDLCQPTILKLQEEVRSAHQSMEDLRAVLTSEVAERHDHVLILRNQLQELRQEYREASLQLQMKSEVIRDLRKQFQECGHLAPKESVATNTEVNDDVESERSMQISKLENELAEKNILLRELQAHLTSSRHEVNLKDETLSKVEGKLDRCRMSLDEKEDRLQFLTSQLTHLQLEVSRLHGQSQLLKKQLDLKSGLVEKLERESESLLRRLNEASSASEEKDKQSFQSKDRLQRLREEVSSQKLTIVTLQDALVSTKQTCDELRHQLDPEMKSLPRCVATPDIKGHQSRRSSTRTCELESVNNMTSLDSCDASALKVHLEESPTQGRGQSHSRAVVDHCNHFHENATIRNDDEHFQVTAASMQTPNIIMLLDNIMNVYDHHLQRLQKLFGAQHCHVNNEEETTLLNQILLVLKEVHGRANSTDQANEVLANVDISDLKSDAKFTDEQATAYNKLKVNALENLMSTITHLQEDGPSLCDPSLKQRNAESCHSGQFHNDYCTKQNVNSYTDELADAANSFVTESENQSQTSESTFLCDDKLPYFSTPRQRNETKFTEKENRGCFAKDDFCRHQLPLKREMKEQLQQQDSAAGGGSLSGSLTSLNTPLLAHRLQHLQKELRQARKCQEDAESSARDILGRLQQPASQAHLSNELPLAPVDKLSKYAQITQDFMPGHIKGSRGEKEKPKTIRDSRTCSKCALNDLTYLIQ